MLEKTRHILVILTILTTGFSSHADYDAQSFIKGGSYLTSNHSLNNTIINSPSLLSDREKFNLEIKISLRASEDAYKLSQMDTNIAPGTYEQTFGPLFRTTNNAFGIGSAGIGWKGFGVSYFANAYAEALLNNPVYPNAKAKIWIDEGYVVGYGSNINKVTYGVSYSKFLRKEQISSADVLNYEDGVVESKRDGFYEVYNFSIGYNFTSNLKTIFNYKKDWNEKDRYFIGSSYKFNSFNFHVEGHDLQNNNVENSLHYGMDYKLSILKLSVGMNQNYPTYGAGIDFKHFNLTVGYGGMNIYEQYRRPYNNYLMNLSFGYNL